MAPTNRSILVLFAHPSIHHSIVNQRMLDKIGNIPDIYINDLYESYPEFYIDVAREQTLIQNASLIIFQHPLYWFSSPPILKLWQDVVLTKGFAYGPGGDALKNKDFVLAISTGGKQESYQPDAKYGASIDAMLAPIKATAKLCGMNYHPPILIHSSSYQSAESIEHHAQAYQNLLTQYLQQGSEVFPADAEATIVTP